LGGVFKLGVQATTLKLLKENIVSVAVLYI